MGKIHNRSKRYVLNIPKNEIHRIFALIKEESNESCGVLTGKRLNKYEFFITDIVFDDKPIDPSKSSFSIIRVK